MVSAPPADCGDVLVFGCTGMIGVALAEAFAAAGWRVHGVSRSAAVGMAPGMAHVIYDPLADGADSSVLAADKPYDAVVWAQGANFNDNIQTFDRDRHEALYRANCLYNLVTLNQLLTRRLLAQPSRLVVISSIWQNLARPNKLSYCVTKAALQGFVLSAAADLAIDGHLINAILPGPLDSPMTRAALGASQIAKVESATPFGRLPALSDVTNLALFLSSKANTGLTGQFIEADLGFSRVRVI